MEIISTFHRSRRFPEVKGKAGLLSFIASILVLTAPSYSFASDITINDCNGVTRAQQVIATDGERFDLTVTLQGDAPYPEKVTLVSAEFTAEAMVNKGKLEFSDLSQGVYELCDSERMTKISRASFERSSEMRVASVGGMALGAAAISGAALAIGSAGSSSTGSGSSIDSTIAGQSGNNLIGSIPAPERPRSPASSNATTSTADSRECLNSAKVNPLSPFD